MITRFDIKRASPSAKPGYQTLEERFRIFKLNLRLLAKTINVPKI